MVLLMSTSNSMAEQGYTCNNCGLMYSDDPALKLLRRRDIGYRITMNFCDNCMHGILDNFNATMNAKTALRNMGNVWGSEFGSRKRRK